MSAWLAISLGGLIERFERALDRLFGLNGQADWVDLDVTALLRTDLAARMAALSQGVQGGVLTPNDARRREGLSPVEGGDQAFHAEANDARSTCWPEMAAGGTSCETVASTCTATPTTACATAR